MKEIEAQQEILAGLLASPEEVPLNQLGSLRDGVSKHYKGKHRSENKGKGLEALLRNNWMRKYSQR